MTYPAEMRARAVDLLAQGMSQRATARIVGAPESTIRRWNSAYTEAGPAALELAPTVREQIIRDGPGIVLAGLLRLQRMIAEADQEQLRDVAHATTAASNIVLDWTEGRRGTQMAVAIDARQQLAVQLAGLDTATLEGYLERLIAAPEPDGDMRDGAYRPVPR